MSRSLSFFHRLGRFGFAVLMAWSLGAASLQAENLLYEITFNGPDGSIPKGWKKAGQAEPVSQFGIKNGVYRADAGNDFVVSWYDGPDLKGQPSASWTDYTVKATVRLAGEAMTGVIARFKDPTSFYHARINGTESKAKFELYRIGGPNGSIALADPEAIFYPSGESWRIELTVAGDLITAKLFDVSGKLISTLSGTDNLYHSGAGGVRVFSRGFAAVVKFSASTP